MPKRPLTWWYMRGVQQGLFVVAGLVILVLSLLA
jgi:hypothetical protein